MIAIEKFGHLVSSSSQQGKPQVSMSVADGQALINDILELQSTVIHLQAIAINALQQANDPIPSTVEADAGRF
jgi:hypothetical protein|tara:strand:- start:140 stop:358 length:219 start_codon:yes stop_codon:yes gene_type:complete